MMPTSEEQPAPASATSAPDLGKFATEIDHIAIAVRNLEQSITFFCNVLGFELHERRKTEGKATAMISAVLKAGPITVVLLEGTSPESQVTKFVDHYGPGVQHIAIGVKDLPQAAEELRRAGLAFDTTVIESPGLRQIFTRRDSGSGLMIEFIERMGGDFSDQSVQQLFQQLEAKDSF
ncbi:MAG TPA: VOC family protein [Thermoanaerobaculia bacterium]|jgi:4-hydroxyphenylpyruvate dioxygenase-like putative hemolysin|nr:VOC family protein [Thermoanaerobaculia bacterium]